MTNADLIVHGRTVHPARATCNCTRQLADALEAAEAQAARLSAIAKAAITHLDGTTVSGDLRRALANRDWPADLLEAVLSLSYGADHDHNHEVALCPLCKSDAILRRYGLLPEEAR